MEAMDSAAEALTVIESALDFLNGPGREGVIPPELGPGLQSLSRIGSKYSAAWNWYLSRFDANDCHDEDGYQNTTAWLKHKTQTTLPQARGNVQSMRRITGRPILDAATADGTLSQAWAAQVINWTKVLPPELRDMLDPGLVDAARAGADLDDLAMLARELIDRWRQQQPGPDEPDDGFGDRRVTLAHTFGGAGRLTGDLTPECGAALQAVFDSLGKKQGKEDTRTRAQRFHDALQEACELLIRAKMVPDRAGSDTRVDGVISLAGLRSLDGAGLVEEAWLAAGAEAGHHFYVSGDAAEALACDALLTPVVTAGADWPVIGQMVEVILDTLGGHALPHRENIVPSAGMPPRPEALPISPETWNALLCVVAKLSLGFVSGPGGLASVLRTTLMPAPWNSRSVPIDVGWSESIPEPIRRAVALRDKRCRWPGCHRRPSVCDVHHIKHKKRGGKTSVDSCILLCQYHHDICIHRWGWEIELLPDGEVNAYGPHGQILRSHSPPETGPPGPARAA